MKRRAIRIEYDGTNFCGWQLQPEVRTIQGELERAVALASGENSRIVLHGAGRTDSGVHARGQVAHFNSAAPHSPDTYLHAINYWLPEDVGVTAAAVAPPDFHARFSAESKTYCYSLRISRTKRPIKRRYFTRISHPPDKSVLDACASRVLGRHDFSAFTNSDADTESTVKNISCSEWEREGESLRYVVKGDGFTYNMVRRLVGGMLEAALGKSPVKNFNNALDGGKCIPAAPTAPAEGLMLVEVKYPESLDPFRPIPGKNS